MLAESVLVTSLFFNSYKFPSSPPLDFSVIFTTITDFASIVSLKLRVSV